MQERGQAAVEAALTMPLMVFMLLGTMQLFMMMHGRILTQLAAFQVTRTASLNHGNCARMLHSGILQVLPAIEPFAKNNGQPLDQNVATAFAKYSANTYNNRVVYTGAGNSTNINGTVMWIVRNITGRAALSGPQADDDFDQGVDPMVMESKVIFWFPMKVPFANWVIARSVLAHYGLQAYGNQNPLLVNMKSTNWSSGPTPTTMASEIRNEMQLRLQAGEYVFPIMGSYTMRMMTPLKRANYSLPGNKNCLPTPQTL
jgi:hypothetical protein